MTKINVPIKGIPEKEKNLINKLNQACKENKPEYTTNNSQGLNQPDSTEESLEEKVSKQINTNKEYLTSPFCQEQMPTPDTSENPNLYLNRDSDVCDPEKKIPLDKERLLSLINNMEAELLKYHTTASPEQLETLSNAKKTLDLINNSTVSSDIPTYTEGILDLYNNAVDGVKSFLAEHKSFPQNIAKALLFNQYDNQPITDDDQNPKDEFQSITDKMHQIYLAKNNDYGSSFDKTFDEYGMTSLLVRLSDKLNRLKSLSINQQQVKDESVQDTLLDIANYAILGLIKIKNSD